MTHVMWLSATRREYRYHIAACPGAEKTDRPLFLRDRTWFINKDLDLAAMQVLTSSRHFRHQSHAVLQLAANQLWGSHNFAAFRNAGSDTAVCRHGLPFYPGWP